MANSSTFEVPIEQIFIFLTHQYNYVHISVNRIKSNKLYLLLRDNYFNN